MSSRCDCPGGEVGHRLGGLVVHVLEALGDVLRRVGDPAGGAVNLGAGPVPDGGGGVGDPAAEAVPRVVQVGPYRGEGVADVAGDLLGTADHVPPVAGSQRVERGERVVLAVGEGVRGGRVGDWAVARAVAAGELAGGRVVPARGHVHLAAGGVGPARLVAEAADLARRGGDVAERIVGGGPG